MHMFPMLRRDIYAVSRKLGQRRLCASMDAFGQLLQRGVGASAKLHAMKASIVDALAERGWCALDGILDDEAGLHVRRELAQLFRDGAYSPSYSSVAETGEKLWRPNVHMMELDAESWRRAPSVVVLLSELMGALPEVVNTGFGGHALDGHAHPQLSSRVFGHKLAVSTAAGARYPKHLDNVTGANDKRKLTAVYYANAGWDVAKQGGAIRLYDSLTHPVYTDVAPAGEGGLDRLLLFWSDLIVHEVLPMTSGPAPSPQQWSIDGSNDSDAHHRHTFTLWLTTENDACLLDPRSSLYNLRTFHYPDKSE